MRHQKIINLFVKKIHHAAQSRQNAPIAAAINQHLRSLRGLQKCGVPLSHIQKSDGKTCRRAFKNTGLPTSGAGESARSTIKQKYNQNHQNTKNNKKYFFHE